MNELYALRIQVLWLAIKRQPISFKFLCVYFFFEYVRPQSLYPALDILPWSQSFLMLTIFFAVVDRTVSWPSNTMNKLLILFTVILIVSGIFAFYPQASWGYRNTMLSWILAYFLVVSIVNTKERLFLFVLIYLLFNLKMGQHGAIEWIRRGFTFEKYGLSGAPGPFRNSGEYAIQMLIFGSLAISFVLSLRVYWGRYKTWILFAAAFTGYVTVMGASSRGSQIALAVIGIWVLLKLKNGLKGAIALVVLGGLLYNLLPDEQMQRFTNMGEDQTSLQRVAYWEAGIKVIKDYPVLGVGYNNWMPYMTNLYPEGIGVLNKIELSHNIFIQAGSELGLFGLFIFLMMVIVAFKMNAKTRSIITEDDKFTLYLSYGLDAGLIGFLVAGSFVTVLYYPFFWIQIAMIAMLNNVASTRKLFE